MKHPNMIRTGVVKRSGNPNSSNTVNGLAIIHELVFLIVQISNLNEGNGHLRSHICIWSKRNHWSLKPLSVYIFSLEAKIEEKTKSCN